MQLKIGEELPVVLFLCFYNYITDTAPLHVDRN